MVLSVFHEKFTFFIFYEKKFEKTRSKKNSFRPTKIGTLDI